MLVLSTSLTWADCSCITNHRLRRNLFSVGTMRMKKDMRVSLESWNPTHNYRRFLGSSFCLRVFHLQMRMSVPPRQYFIYVRLTHLF